MSVWHQEGNLSNNLSFTCRMRKGKFKKCTSLLDSLPEKKAQSPPLHCWKKKGHTHLGPSSQPVPVSPPIVNSLRGIFPHQPPGLTPICVKHSGTCTKRDIFSFPYCLLRPSRILWCLSAEHTSHFSRPSYNRAAFRRFVVLGKDCILDKSPVYLLEKNMKKTE